MKRSVWKLPYIHSVFFKKRIFNKSSILLKIRHSVIPSNFIDKRIRVYNGIWYLSKDVTTGMLGIKLGQFSFTKKSDKQLHKKRRTKKKSKKF